MYRIVTFISLLLFSYLSYSQNVGVGVATPTTKMDISGDLALREGTALALVNGANNNLAPSANSFIRITGPTAAFSVTGLAGGQNGKVLVLYNTTAFAMTIANENAGSVLNNRITTLTGADLATPATNGASVTLMYNSTTSRWVVLAATTSPSSGFGWGLTGNAGTTPAANFIGTIDNQSWLIKTTNLERVRVDSIGNVGIGTVGLPNLPPITQLHVPGKTPTTFVGTVAAVNGARSVFIQGRYAYMVIGWGAAQNFQIFDVSNPTAPISIFSTALPEFPYDVYVQGRYAYIGANFRLRIYDISNPSAPVAVGNIATGQGSNKVYVQGRYAYVACINNPDYFDIFDIANPALPVQIDGAFNPGVGCAGLCVQGRYAYTAGAGFRIIDVSTPSAPVIVSTLAGVNATDPNSVVVNGRYAYVADYFANRLHIVDIKNPAAPILVTSFITTSPYGVFLQGRYAYLFNQAGQLLSIDVSNPAVPVQAGSVGLGGAPGLGLFVSGRYAYYATGSGNSLRVVDLGGAYIQELETGGLETGTATIRTNLSIYNDADIKGGLTVGRGAQITGNMAVNGDICHTGGIAACSDLRYKNNILPIAGALSSVLQMQGVNYYWDKTKFPDKQFSDTKQIGFIAQDIEKLYPECVFTDEKGYKAIDYAKLTPVLVEAIKDQNNQLQRLQNENLQEKVENQTLSIKIQSIKKQMDDLTKLLNSK